MPKSVKAGQSSSTEGGIKVSSPPKPCVIATFNEVLRAIVELKRQKHLKVTGEMPKNIIISAQNSLASLRTAGTLVSSRLVRYTP